MTTRKKVSSSIQEEINIWKKNNIPALEYCDLHRATELLNCKLNDLLHWAEIGAIELCLKFTGFEVCLTYEDDIKHLNDLKEWLRYRLSNNKTDKIKLSGIIPCHIPGSNVNSDDCDEMFAYMYHIFGLWTPIIPPYNNLYSSLQFNREKQITSNLLLKPADEDSTSIRAMVLPTEMQNEIFDSIHPAKKLFSITPSDLFITKNQIEKIYNHDGKPIPNYINGGIDIPLGIEMPIKPENINLNTNMLGQLIDMLISSVPELGPDVAKTNPNRKRGFLVAYLNDQQNIKKLVDYKIPNYDTFVKYFKK
ncbi:hypothetical protein MUU47_16155 [Scandinavium sp. H11S7]|uniref:Uncharacterized protein n=1 Tax=Scandinavium hiltneri TaxID=2926519 RepID=A0ABT2E424_9ENTR|nr:hypothetical protein [Scandinavium hiltneri]MCS2162624.1 hypothetical protein [Scandinavium hiltneri]